MTIVFYSYCIFTHFQRREIVTGNIEPTDSDCDWPSDDEDAEEQKLVVSVFFLKVVDMGILLSSHLGLPCCFV